MNWPALLEALLIFGGALAFALHQLYQLRADKRPDDKNKKPPAAAKDDKPDADPPPPG